MREKIWLSIALCLVVLVSGCATPLGPSATETQTSAGADEPSQTADTKDRDSTASAVSPSLSAPGGNSGGDAPYGVVRIYITGGVPPESFVMDVQFEAPRDRSLTPTTFQDVVLCMYSENGTVLNSTIVGNLDTPKDEVSVEMGADERPEYIVVDHPRFRTYGEIYPEVILWDERFGGRYDNRWGPLEDLDPGFEYPRHTETGRCM